MQIINPNGRIGTEYEAIEPPVWAGFIANLEYADLIDAEQLNLTPEETARKVYKNDVLIVAMGKNPSVSSTPKMEVIKQILPYLKDKNVKLTGIHPQALKEEVEREFNCEVVSYNPEDFKYAHCPRYHLYRAHNWHALEDISHRSPYGVLVTSFGCPFRCFYCNIHVLYPKKIIYRNPNYIFTELSHMHLRGVKHVKIWDELFALNEDWVNEICDLIINARFKFNFWAYARVDTVKPRMLEKMKKAGINWLAYGMDSKCPYETIHKAVEMSHEAGIHVLGNFMFGLPDEYEGEIEEIANSLDIDWANFYVARPYPGSQWYKEVGVKDWGLLEQYGERKDGLREFRDKAFKHFFSRPNYLRKIAKRFSVKAVKHIEAMVNG